MFVLTTGMTTIAHAAALQGVTLMGVPASAPHAAAAAPQHASNVAAARGVVVSQAYSLTTPTTGSTLQALQPHGLLSTSGARALATWEAARQLAVGDAQLTKAVGGLLDAADPCKASAGQVGLQ
jgi:hypothetical protein